MRLDEYIAALLQDHDCVIVPDFGGFVANYASAKINPVSHRFDPPHRQITFNRLLVHNDGLLAAYIAQKENERYEDALRSVREYVVYLKSELRTNKQVDIQKVGILFHHADGTFRFEQVKDARVFAEGFGLESFFSKRLDQREATKAPVVMPKAAPSNTQPKPAPKPEPKVIVIPKPAPAAAPAETPEPETAPVAIHRKRYWPAVAAAIGLPIIGYAAWVSLSTPLFKDRGSFHYSDLNPFAEKICPLYQSRKDIYDASGLDIPESLAASAEEGQEFTYVYNDLAPDKTLVVRLSEPKERSFSTEAHYHIIGGCFSIQENAEGLVDVYQKRGGNASIIDRKGGLYRVSIASFATKKEAEDALASYQEDIPGAWLLHK